MFKKLIFLLIIILCLPLIVKADQISCENYQYKFYQEEKIYSNKYYKKNEIDDKYPFIDNNYIYSPFSDYTSAKPNIEDIEVEEIKIINFNNLKKVKYLKISDISFDYVHVMIKEIEILNKDVPINYSITCENCKDIFIVNNKKINEARDGYLFQNGNIIIELDNYYNPLDLNIILYLSNYQIGNVTFNLFSSSNEIYNYLKKEIKINELIKTQESKRFTYKFLENNIENNQFEDENNKYITLYRYRERLYKRYKIEKKYLDSYFISRPGYIKDIKDFTCSVDNYKNINIEETDVIHLTNNNLEKPKIFFVNNNKKMTSGYKSDKYRHVLPIIILLLLVSIIIFFKILLSKDRER